MNRSHNLAISDRPDGWCKPFVGAMKIARNPGFSDRPDGWCKPFVGAMKIARNLAVSDRPVEWHSPFPAPSLRELSRPQGVTEGVSPDARNR